MKNFLLVIMLVAFNSFAQEGGQEITQANLWNQIDALNFRNVDIILMADKELVNKADGGGVTPFAYALFRHQRIKKEYTEANFIVRPFLKSKMLNSLKVVSSFLLRPNLEITSDMMKFYGDIIAEIANVGFINKEVLSKVNPAIAQNIREDRVLDLNRKSTKKANSNNSDQMGTTTRIGGLEVQTSKSIAP